MRRFALLLCAAGAVLGLLAEWTAYGWRDPVKWISDLLVGWTFIACGMIAAAREPNSRSGPLMVATGFTWFVGNFASVDAGVVSWVAASGIYLHRGPLVHLILAYPTGRLSSRTSRVAVGAVYATALLPPLWDHEPGAFLLSVLVIAVAGREYWQTVGGDRRARVLSVWAATGLALVLAGGAVARLALPAGDVGEPWLLVYDAVLWTIAAGLSLGLVSKVWQQANITDLVVELEAARPGTLRAGLSRALGDPSLEVGYWSAEANGFLDSAGRLLTLPASAAERSVTRVDRDGAPIAAIVHDAAVLDDRELRDAVAAAAQLEAANTRLQADVQARVVELAAARRRILDARDDERRGLERRLHDEAAHRLGELAVLLDASRRSADGATTRERIDVARTQLAETLGDLDRLGRGLHPRILSEHGLERALASLAEAVPVRVELKVMTGRLSPAIEAAVYFVCAEALANVAKHASAAEASVIVKADDAALTIVVEDDGVGGADPARGSGLQGMADRVGTLGGTLFTASLPDGGTRLTAQIPLGSEAS